MACGKCEVLQELGAYDKNEECGALALGMFLISSEPLVRKAIALICLGSFDTQHNYVTAANFR